MDMEEVLGPFEQPLSMTGSVTPRSRYCESMVRTFLKLRADKAEVHVDRTPYDMETLYAGLRNVSRKQEFKGRFVVHKQDGHLVLVREARNVRL